MKNPWNEQLLPRLTEQLLSSHTVGRYRERVVRELSGELVEIGFGSGLNVPHYPNTVTRVVAIEPSQTARKLASARVASRNIPVDFRGLDGQTLPLPSASVDSALCTFTLCTIPDANRALAELHRVLKPGGVFGFVEHGLSPRSSVERWQHRLNPIQQKLAGGCNLDRRIDELVVHNGFTMRWLENEEMPGPSFSAPWSYVYLGVAQKEAE